MREAPAWFSEDAVARLLDPRRLVDRVEEAFRDYADGRLTEILPARIDDMERGSNVVSFHAYWPARALSTTKVLVGAERNPARGLPMIDATIVALDAAEGRVAAILGARHITAMRTAATSFIALRLMGLRSQASVGLIGTGVQMKAHALLAGVFGASRLFIASAGSDRGRAQAAGDALRHDVQIPVEVLSAEDVAAMSDAVVLSTISQTPVVPAGSFRRDGLIASVGAFLPHATEIDPALIREAGVVLSDHRNRLRAQWRDASDLLGVAYDTMLDLPETIVRGIQPRLEGSRGVFLSDGRSLEDLAAVSVILEQALASGGD